MNNNKSLYPTPSYIDIENLIDTLVQLDIQNDSRSYISIKNALHNYDIPVPCYELENATFFRCRPNNKNEFYQNISCLGPPFSMEKLIDFGRANEPLQAVFYCSEDDETAYSEISEIIRNCDYKDSETFTTGVWKSTRKLVIGHVPFPEDIANKTKTGKWLRDEFNKFVDHNSSAGTPALLKLYNLISKEFQKKYTSGHSHYFLSCAFFNYFIRDIRFDGMAFPSFQRQGSGINYVFRKELILNDSIRLQHAYRQTLTKQGKRYISQDVKCAKPIDQQTGEIRW